MQQINSNEPKNLRLTLLERWFGKGASTPGDTLNYFFWLSIYLNIPTLCVIGCFVEYFLHKTVQLSFLISLWYYPTALVWIMVVTRLSAYDLGCRVYEYSEQNQKEIDNRVKSVIDMYPYLTQHGHNIYEFYQKYNKHTATKFWSTGSVFVNLLHIAIFLLPSCGLFYGLYFFWHQIQHPDFFWHHPGIYWTEAILYPLFFYMEYKLFKNLCALEKKVAWFGPEEDTFVSKDAEPGVGFAIVLWIVLVFMFWLDIRRYAVY